MSERVCVWGVCHWSLKVLPNTKYLLLLLIIGCVSTFASYEFFFFFKVHPIGPNRCPLKPSTTTTRESVWETKREDEEGGRLKRVPWSCGRRANKALGEEKRGLRRAKKEEDITNIDGWERRKKWKRYRALWGSKRIS